MFLFDFHTLNLIHNTKLNKIETKKKGYKIDFYEESIGNNFFRCARKIINEKDNAEMILKSYKTSFKKSKRYNGLLMTGFKDIIKLKISDEDRIYILAFS